MWINFGRFLMLMIWGILVFNLMHPFPKPVKYFLDIAMIFMILMHGLQLILLKVTQPKDQPIKNWQQIKIFLFGVFELLSWQKKQLQTPKK